MEFLFLVVVLLLWIVGESFLDNIWWIGVLVVAYLVYSIFRQFKEVGDGFDGGEVMIVLLKVAGIAAVIWLMVLVI